MARFNTYYIGADPELFSSGGDATGANRTIGNTDNFTLGFVRNGISELDLGADGVALFNQGMVGNDKNAGVATTLAEALDNSETEIDLTSATGFPTSGTVRCESEDITYTGITTNTLTGCTRGAGSTSAATHSNGLAIGLVVNLSGSYNYFSAGPISVATGSVITIASGGTWTIS